MAAKPKAKSEYHTIKSNDQPSETTRDPFRVKWKTNSSRTDLSSAPTYRRHFEKSLNPESVLPGSGSSWTPTWSSPTKLATPSPSIKPPPKTAQASTSNDKPEVVSTAATTNISEKRITPFLPVANEPVNRVKEEEPLPEESILISEIPVSSVETSISKYRKPSVRPLIPGKAKSRRSNVYTKDKPTFIIGPPVVKNVIHPIQYKTDRIDKCGNPIPHKTERIDKNEHPIEYIADRIDQCGYPERQDRKQEVVATEKVNKYEYRGKQNLKQEAVTTDKIDKYGYIGKEDLKQEPVTTDKIDKYNYPDKQELKQEAVATDQNDKYGYQEKQDLKQKSVTTDRVDRKQDLKQKTVTTDRIDRKQDLKQEAPVGKPKDEQVAPTEDGEDHGEANTSTSRVFGKDFYADIKSILQGLDTKNQKGSATAKMIADFYGIPEEFAFAPQKYTTNDKDRNAIKKKPDKVTTLFDKTNSDKQKVIQPPKKEVSADSPNNAQKSVNPQNSQVIPNSDPCQKIENREVRPHGKIEAKEKQHPAIYYTATTLPTENNDQQLVGHKKPLPPLVAAPIEKPVSQPLTPKQLPPKIHQQRKLCKAPPPRPPPPRTKSRVKAMPEPRPIKIPFDETLLGTPERETPVASPKPQRLKPEDIAFYHGDPRRLNEREGQRHHLKYHQGELPSEPPPVPPRPFVEQPITSKEKEMCNEPSFTDSSQKPPNKTDTKVTFSPSTAPSPDSRIAAFKQSYPDNEYSNSQQLPTVDPSQEPDPENNNSAKGSVNKAGYSQHIFQDPQEVAEKSSKMRVRRESDDPCYIGLGSIFLKNARPDEAVTWLPLSVITTRRMKNVIISDVEEVIPVPNFRYPATVEELHVDGVINQNLFLHLLNQLYELKTLEIHISTLHSLHLDKFTADIIELPNLRSLEISCSGFNESDAKRFNLSRIIANLIFLLGLTFPSLSYLGVAVPFVADLEKKILLSIWRCMLNHHETLKLLNIECPFGEPQFAGRALTNQVSPEIVEMDLTGADQINLLSFHLFYWNKVGSTEFWRRFLKTQGSLQYIQFWCEGFVYYKFPYDIVKKNYLHLQTVSMNVDIQSYPDKQNKVPLDCAIFKGMPNLKTIALKGFQAQHPNPRDLLRSDFINISGLSPRMETIKIMNLNIDQKDVRRLVVEWNPNLKVLYLDTIGSHGNLGMTLETLVNLLEKSGNIQKLEIFDSINRKSLEEGTDNPNLSQQGTKGYRLVAKILLKKQSRPSFRAYRTVNNDFEIVYEDDEMEDDGLKDDWVDHELKTKSVAYGPGTKKIVSTLMKPNGRGMSLRGDSLTRVSNASEEIQRIKSSKSFKKMHSSHKITESEAKRKGQSTDNSRRKRKGKKR